MLSVTQARATAESMETKGTSPNREKKEGYELEGGVQFEYYIKAKTYNSYKKQLRSALLVGTHTWMCTASGITHKYSKIGRPEFNNARVPHQLY
jgi:hypothetical protein